MDNSNPYLRTAHQNIQNREFDKAKQLLISILNNEPQNSDAWYLLGVALQEPKETAYCLRQAISFQPDHPEAVEGLDHLERNFNLIPLQVMILDAGSAAIGNSCPFCKQIFCEGEKVVSCPQCRGSQHYSCWVDNGFTCARRLCSGFSVKENNFEPLPIQPQKPAGRMIVIRKENMTKVKKVTRVEKEEPFLRKILIMKLLAEDGQIPPEQAASLADVELEDLLKQYQRDRSKSDESDDALSNNFDKIPEPSAISMAPIPRLEKFCVHCGKSYLQDVSRFCAYCGKPRQ